MTDSRTIKKTTLADQVFDAIKESVTSEQYQPGDKIPSENELAALYGVNRLTVRLALQKLNTLGVVETRQGEGTFVKRFSFTDYISEISDFYMKPEMLDDVCAFRKLIEVECVRLAIEHYSREDINVLEKIYLEYAGIPYIGTTPSASLTERFIELDYQFHYQICKMSQNSLYILAYKTAKEIICRYLRVIARSRLAGFQKEGYINDKGNLLEKADLHLEILNGIKAKDFDACKKIYETIVDYKELEPASAGKII